MGVMPMGRLILSMSVPMILSMLVQALYNVVDSVFVARYSQDALAALSYAFPAQQLMIGVATGTGVGVNSLLSKSLGEKNYEKANKTAANGVLLAMLGFVLFFVFGTFFAEPFIAFQTKTLAVVEAGRQYLSIVTMLSFGIFGEIIFERLMQSTGTTIYTMITQGSGAIVNIILDPIMIFGLLGCPQMGIAGAAYATVIGQIVAFLLAILLNHRYNTEVRLHAKNFKPDGSIIGRIYAVGIPSIIMMGIGSIMTTSMNKILNGFSDVAASVFGVYFKLQSFAFMPVFGLNNGVIPVIAYNYGAQKRKRMLHAVRLGCIIATCFMAVGILLMQCIPAELFALFDASEEMLAIGVPALRIISISFVFAGVCIALSSVFQALGKGIYSMCISFARQLVVLVPAAYLLSLSGNVNAVWWSYPIAEIASITVSLLFFRHVYKTIIAKIPE